MKKLLLIGLLVAAPVIVYEGCTTSQQRVVFNTLYSVEHATTASVDSYDSMLVSGLVSTNTAPTVARAYNNFQAAFKLALDAAQYNTNALASPALVKESQDVITLINQIKATPLNKQ